MGPRCPSCGGYQVNDQPVRIDPKTGRPVDKHPFWEGCGQAVLVYVGAWVVSVIGLAIAWAFGASANNPVSPTVNFCGGAVVFFLVVVWPIGLIVRGIVLSSRNAQLPWTHRYKCATCGHTWSE